MRRRRAMPLVCLHFMAVICLSLWACSNNPYPNVDDSQKVLYAPFSEPPKTMDPAVAYSTTDHAIMGPIYDTLLEYHYLKRPYTLIPGLAQEVPTVEAGEDGKVIYTFTLREGLYYQDDPCFALSDADSTTRELVASDVAFSLFRIGDPEVGSPVITSFRKIVGFSDYSTRLSELRKEDGFRGKRIDQQYQLAGPIDGIEVSDKYQLRITLSEAYPQILYWFAMQFTAPVPWEAVTFYHGKEGRDAFAEHPVGAGPYQIVHYAKRNRIRLERNPNWYGAMYPEWDAPGARYPLEGEAEDTVSGRLDANYRGKGLPFIDRIEFYYEKESIPTFTKFLQGYYDASGIIRESFDRVVQEGDLSEDMASLGMHLEKSVEPSVFYLGFNMNDDVVGTPAGEAGKKLRQAMSLVIDADEYKRLFTNGRGVTAHSPIPPGLSGYDENYQNPFRVVDFERARQLLVEAGYSKGIDPKTNKPLHLTFDTPDTSARGRITYQFYVNAWNRLGLDVEIAATDYNQFRQKVEKGAYQLFQWGWIADYPDPENFLFLLWSAMAQATSGGPNTANFSNPRYDELFLRMKGMEDGPARLAVIGEMLQLLEEERPWIELFHREAYSLYHSWVKNMKPMGLPFSTIKYRDVNPIVRSQKRSEWNRPVTWPLYALGILTVVIVVPGIITFMRERQ